MSSLFFSSEFVVRWESTLNKVGSKEGCLLNIYEYFWLRLRLMNMHGENDDSECNKHMLGYKGGCF